MLNEFEDETFGVKPRPQRQQTKFLEIIIKKLNDEVIYFKTNIVRVVNFCVMAELC